VTTNKKKFALTILVNVCSIFSFLYLYAHELSPNITNLKVEKNGVRIEFVTNVEAYITGVDFSMLDNTKGHKNLEYYKKLRTLGETELSSVFLNNWNEFTSLFTLVTEDGRKLDKFFFSFIEIEEIDNPKVPRLGTIHFFVEAFGVRSFTFKASKKLGDIILRQEGVENGVSQYLTPGEKSVIISNDKIESRTKVDIFFDYILAGFYHILPKGLDHILFVMGLLFLTPKIAPLVMQISIFTLAHTITLAMNSLGLVTIAAGIVEPLIALSIVYIAYENIYRPQLTKYRIVTIFLFGLLHGLGFANVLKTFGLPEENLILALFGFNIGVEIGQITIVLLGFIVLTYIFKGIKRYRVYVTLPGSLFIGIFGLWWMFERMLVS
tara:strand:+ start:87 stop:1226 length:1140 start_codon:yes stop_codon:yes gene_type:complete